MVMEVPALKDIWPVASLYAPSVPDNERRPFANFMLSKIVEEFEHDISYVNLRNRQMGIVSQVKLKGTLYRLVDIMSFVSMSMFINEDYNLEISKTNIYGNTGYSAEQLFRLVYYGNQDNVPNRIMVSIFDRIKQRMATYWLVYYKEVKR